MASPKQSRIRRGRDKVQLFMGLRGYFQQITRTIVRRALATFCAVEVLATSAGAVLVHQATGSWPTPELWLAVAGSATALASAADHLVAGWTIRRAIRYAPMTLASSLFATVGSSGIGEKLGEQLSKMLKGKPKP
jgi:hypothetical protein